ncbi:hypothetical protein AQUCO_03000009v1 [Aquilegia coerulea]|uniref:Large ribosomal subunit protein bL9c n=1 Tax=Aquilegia coerulea TaxID=218851 RepID=A0A2G5D0V0_AQUCA|nr:hypothetical protein AQUCO_03000009v1 [Aquilegia coerulea]
MASTTTLSWSSSSLFNNLTPNISETSRISEKKTTLMIVAQQKAQKLRKIILKQDIALVGKKGDVKDVKAGYYRNYLHPLGMAQIVTPTLIKEMKMEEERIEAEKQRVKEEAQQLARIFETVGAFKVKRKSGKGKQIFGTVTPQDLVDIIKAQIQRYDIPIHLT